MLTRRSFLGTVAAVAVSPVASKKASAAVILIGTDGNVEHVLSAADFAWPRRDDGDTILELR